MPKTVIQTISAPNFGNVAGGDITIETNIHVHRSQEPYTIILFIVLLVTVVAAFLTLPKAPTFERPTVPMVAVQSSAIAAVGYDASSRKLFVDFANGKHSYTYCQVPEAVFAEFNEAKSKGIYFNRYIRQEFTC